MTLKNPLVSIVLPVYNGEKFLKKAIRSCLNQTYKNIELIIVNDCSTDKSLQIAKEFGNKDIRVKVISNSRNEKLPTSLNIGHKAASGEYLTWTSHDNFYEENAIEILFYQILKSEADIVYSNFFIIEKNGARRKKIKLEEASSLIFGNSIGASFLYKKDVFFRNRGYDENLHSVEDYDFWLRSTIHSNFYHIRDSLYNFRSHDASLSSKLSIENTPENKLFTKKLKKCYQNYFEKLRYNHAERYSELFTRIHQYREFDVLSFIQNYLDFEMLLKKIGEYSDVFEFEELVKDSDIRLRANIQEYKKNQNLTVLIQLLLRRPSLLLRYDKKNSLKIIRKCLK